MKLRLPRPPGRGRRCLLALGALLGALTAAPVAAQGFYESNRSYFFGMGDLRCYGGMVDVPTGAVRLRFALPKLPGRIGHQLAWYYNSQDGSNGPFGKGTSLSVSYFLTAGPSGGIDLITPGHRRYTFTWQYDWHTGTYAYEDNRDPEMLGAVYTQTGYGAYDGTLRFKNGDKLIFLSGILTRMQDLHGNFVDVDPGGSSHIAIRLGGSTYPRVDFTYDANWHITAMTYWYTGSPGSRQWTFAYDANQRLSTVTNPLGGVTRYTWSTYTRALDGQVLPLIATITNPRNNVPFTAQYDTSGRITQVTAADAGVTTFAYTAAPGSDGTTTVTDPRNNGTSWSYTWPAPQSGTIKYGYRLTGSTDALGRTTTYQALHTGSQLITKITDFQNRITTLDWDFYLGNLTSVTKPTVSGGTVTTDATYEGGCSLCTSVTDPLGRQATATVSGGNVTQTTTPRTYHSNYSYDATTGDLTSMTPPVGQSFHLSHNYYGDVTIVSNDLYNLGTFTYDNASRRLSATDANGKTTTYVYDLLDRVTAVQQTLNGQTLTTSFEYDADSNRTAMVDPAGHRWEWSFDSMDRMVQDKNPLLQTRAYVLDKNGNLTQYTDRLSQSWVFTYGAGDRIATKTFKKADSTTESTVTYSYDPLTKLLTSVNDSLYGTVSYGYDILDRLVSVTRPSSSGNQTITYTLDNLGRRTGLQVPGQGAISYGFDNDDNIVSIAQNAKTTSLAYDELDRMTQRTLPTTPAVATTWTYNSGHFLNVMSSTKGGVEFDHRLYERANDGTLARETSNGVVTNYCNGFLAGARAVSEAPPASPVSALSRQNHVLREHDRPARRPPRLLLPHWRARSSLE